MREYLPRAIYFVVDVFKGFKAVVQGVILAVLEGWQTLFVAAEKIPGIGDKFSGLAKFFTEASDVISDQLKDNVEGMGKWKKSSDEAASMFLVRS